MLHYLNKLSPLCLVLTGSVISLIAFSLATTSARAQSPSFTTGSEYSADGFGDAGDTEISLNGLMQPLPVAAGSVSSSISYASLSDASRIMTVDPGNIEIKPFADGSACDCSGLMTGARRTFVLDNPMAGIVSGSGANKLPKTNPHNLLSAGGVEYVLLNEALQDSEYVFGFSGIDKRSRHESNTIGISNVLFASIDIQNPLEKQNAGTLSYNRKDYSAPYGRETPEPTPLYYHQLTDQHNLKVHAYRGYLDASFGHADDGPYPGLALTISREVWPK